MTIKVSYTYASPVYINIGYGAVDGGAVWGDITGTLSNQADLQTALNAKVPYSGATGNVNLGEYELKAGQLTFDTSPTGTATVATMRWNDTTGLTETTLKGGSVLLKNGVDLVARVVNKVNPNTTLTKAAYQAVRVSGAQGQRLAVAFAQANNDNNSADTIGLVTETISPNQEGFIMTVGQLEGINTTGSLQGETWVDGDVLYLSPTTAGALTNVKPVAPQHLVIIGYVEYAHANNGKIYVKVMNGWELGELHDVNTTGATNGSVLKYNGSIWVPSSDIDTGITTLNTLTALSQSFATGTSGTDFNISSATSTHTFNLPSASATNRGLLTSADWTTFNNKQNALTNPVTGTGVSGQVAYWSGTNTQTGSNNLFWDNTNGRLGIGTNTPNNPLQIGATPAASLQVPLASIVSTYNAPAASGNSIVNALVVAGDSPTNRGIFTSTKSRGTITSPTAVLSGDLSLSLISNLFDGTNAQGSAAIQFEAESNASAGSAPQLIRFDTGSTGAGRTTKMQLRSNGNLILQNGGTFTDAGQRLQVTGDTLLRGSGNTSATTALTVQNSDGTNVFRVRNDGNLSLGSTLTTLIRPAEPSNGTTLLSGRSIAFESELGTGLGYQFWFRNSFGNSSQIGDINGVIRISSGFVPTSGTGVFNTIAIQNTINQTGGANGITRGLYVNPTLTAAADWRSIETSNNSGWSYYGAGTANSYFGGSLGIGSVSLADSTLRLGKNMTGGTTHTAIYNDGTIQTDVTTSGIYFRTQARTAASVAITNVVHYYAQNLTLGSSSTVTNQFGYHADSGIIGATNNYGFYGNIASGTGRWNFYANGTALNYMNGSLLIGSATDSGQKLQVTGDTLLKGSGADGGSIALTVQNSAASNLFRVRNDGYILIGPASTSAAPAIYSFEGTLGLRSLRIGIQSAGSLTPIPAFNINQENNFTYTTGTGEFTTITANFLPTSGTGTLASLVIRNTINQTGGANGITRGLYVNPTLTSAADWRSIETSNNTGWAAYFAGSADLFFGDGADVQIGTTNGTKLGTATSQKIGFWNATPIVQPTTAVASATRVGGAGNTVTDTDTYDGYTLPQIVKALRNAGLLA